MERDGEESDGKEGNLKREPSELAPSRHHPPVRLASTNIKCHRKKYNKKPAWFRWTSSPDRSARPITYEDTLSTVTAR